MKMYKTKIKDLLIIKGRIHKDSRGYFREVLVEELLNKNAPGCSISGTFKLRKVAGNFHIALGKNLMASQKGVTHTSNTPKYQFSFKDIALVFFLFQSEKDFKIGITDKPNSVSEYSTFGGTT